MQTSPSPLLAPAEQVVLDRRHLHAHPELGFEEHETARFVTDRLQALGLDVQTGVGGTGVVGLIHGGMPGKTVLLRADMDALPIHELNEVPYRSQNRGVMHACGHDAHTAILLNAARILVDRRQHLAGTIKLCFQPCEESYPGGAVRMIADGVLESPKVDAAFGLHVSQDTAAGVVATCPGPMMAASDAFVLEVTGVGGHGAYPHQCVDAVMVGAHIVVALQTIVSREVDPIQPAVITVASIRAGTASNVIPSTCTMTGTVRTFDQTLRHYLARRIEEVASGVARSLRAECTCSYTWGNPPVVNDPAMTDLVLAAARDTLGPDKVILDDLTMGAEDFSSFLEAVPGNFFNVGTRNDERGLIFGHHHPRFDIDEAALPVAVDMMVAVAERYLATI